MQFLIDVGDAAIFFSIPALLLVGLLTAIHFARKDIYEYEGTPSPITETAPNPEGGLSFYKMLYLRM